MERQGSRQRHVSRDVSCLPPWPHCVLCVVVDSAGHQIVLAFSDGLDGTKVVITKPQVDPFVFPVAHDVIVPAGRPSSKFGLRLWPSVLRFVVFLLSPGAGAVCLLRNLTKTKAYKNDFQLLPKEIDAKVAKITLSSTRCELSAICGTYRISSSMANSSSPSMAPARVVPHTRGSTANSSSPSRAPAGVVPHSRSSMGNSSSPSRAPSAEKLVVEVETPSCTRVSSKFRRVRLRQQRHRS